ncbi:hypothetical protein GCM10010472_10790 [Pseudonocardia halophobica]|uniref:Uncharacterized protein n=1 Tax=Pseudonocardia halophobica TaxID=29401 RepID=A0A9W6NY79_9PSEU|nr:hypothetical protein [Pseudonocardia halophobica]GLL13466.1 hypothetical protein GCM10017577_46100 [Pseudonocardia halophobica]
MAAARTKKTDTRPAEAKPDAKQGSCKLPGCVHDAAHRGLCEAHWYTHRGLADVDPDAPKNEDEGVTVA